MFKRNHIAFSQEPKCTPDGPIMDMIRCIHNLWIFYSHTKCFEHRKIENFDKYLHIDKMSDVKISSLHIDKMSF